jgi:predicted MFS family arabinose efflux permease
VSFLAVIVGLLLMRTREFFRPEGVTKHERPLRALREGFSYLLGSRELQALMGVAVVFGVFGFSAIRTLLSVHAGETLHSDARTFGWLFAAYGTGAVIGGLTSATFSRASWRRLFAGAVVFGGGLVVLAPLRSALLCAAVLVAIGGAWTTWASEAQSIAVLAAPERMRGRVVSLYNSALLIGVPFGALLDGWLADVGGTTLAFAVAGTAGLAATGVAALSLQRRRTAAAEGLAKA